MGGLALTQARGNMSQRSARSPGRKKRDHIQELFNEVDQDGSGYLDRDELALLAGRAGRHLSQRQLDDAMTSMDGDGSGQVDLAEFTAWIEHGRVLPPQGSAVFQRVSEQLERKVANVRKLFRKFDENKDGTVSTHEFRTGLKNSGIDLTEREFQQLMGTIDEDNSGEIDYQEFAKSGVIGGRLFAARTKSSGARTRNELLKDRKMEERRFGQSKMDAFWARAMVEPRLSMPATVI